MSHGQAIGNNTQLQRMEFVYKGQSYTFTLNPTNYEETTPSRTHTFYTKNGAHVEKFGKGITEISFSGTTGFRGDTEDNSHGYKRFVELKKLLEREMLDAPEGRPIEDYLLFYNHTDGEAYVTVLQKFGLLRNVNEPLLYKFDISLQAIRRVGDPVPSKGSQGIGNVEGNPNKTGNILDANRKANQNNNNNISAANTDTSFDAGGFAEQSIKRPNIKETTIRSEGKTYLVPSNKEEPSKSVNVIRAGP